MFLNKSELKSNFWELFKWSSVIRKQPIKLYSEKKFYQVSIKEFIKYMATLHKQLPEAFCKKGVLRNFVCNIIKNWDSGASVFLWILQNVLDTFSTEHLGTTAFVPISIFRLIFPRRVWLLIVIPEKILSLKIKPWRHYKVIILLKTDFQPENDE